MTKNIITGSGPQPPHVDAGHVLVYLAALLCRMGPQTFNGAELQRIVDNKPNIEFFHDDQTNEYAARVLEEDAISLYPLLGGVHPALRDIRALVTMLAVMIGRHSTPEVPVTITVKDIQAAANFTLQQTLDKDGTWTLKSLPLPPDAAQSGKLN